MTTWTWSKETAVLISDHRREQKFNPCFVVQSWRTWFFCLLFNQLSSRIFEQFILKFLSFVLVPIFTRMAGSPTTVFTPFFRSPFTDLTGGLVNAQHYDKCGPMELKMVECLEAYGIERGKVKCAELLDDYYECFTLRKQQLRTAAMRMERHKQWFKGDLKEHYQQPGPRVDGF